MSTSDRVARCLYVVTIEVSPAIEERWNEWHNRVHIPEVLREPGFLACRKWRDTQLTPDGWVRYVCHYKLVDREVFEKYAKSAAAQRLRADHNARFETVTRLARQVLELQSEAL